MSLPVWLFLRTLLLSICLLRINIQQFCRHTYLGKHSRFSPNYQLMSARITQPSKRQCLQLMQLFPRFIVNVFVRCASLKLRHTLSLLFDCQLTTQFKHWAESEYAFDNLETLRELFMMEQFNSHLESGMCGWLVDQKPESLSELARLAD